MDLATLAKEIGALKGARRVAELAARKSVIDAEVAKVSSKAVKRTLRHNMESLDNLKDLGEVWSLLGIPFPSAVGAFDEISEAALPDGQVATRENFEAVNAAFEEFTKHVAVHREHIQHEINMQIVSTTSPMGWSAVEQLEIGFR
jgi:hypothetical protein